MHYSSCAIAYASRRRLSRTFVAADCFLPPSNYQPHTWERIAVPPATSSHGNGRIYKRVPSRGVDRKYNVAAAELDSQGFDMRKRVKMTSHKSAWGLHAFDPRYEAAMSDQDEIAKARGRLFSRDNVRSLSCHAKHC